MSRNGTLWIILTYWFAFGIIFDTAEAEIPSCLATVANADPWVLTNPIAIWARTFLTPCGAHQPLFILHKL